MPTFQFTSPDGKTYEVDGPEGSTQEQAFAQLQGSLNGPLSRMEKVGQGMKDPISGGAQLLTRALPDSVVQAGNQLNNWIADKTGLVGRLPEGGVDQQVRDQEAVYQARRQAAGETGVDGYRLIGNVASPANLAIASRVPAAAGLGGRMAVGAAAGAGSSLLNPATGREDYWTEKGKQAALGAAFGGATPLATMALSRIISPNASTNPNVQTLQNEGVQPTIGQTLGGWANRLEEKATSIPLIGDSISAARARAQNQFNSAAINRATAPIGVKVEGTGQEAVRKAGDAIGDAYDAARNSMGSFQLDGQARQEITRIGSMVQLLPPQQQSTFRGVVDAIRTDVSPNGTISANVFKDIDSKLAKEAAVFSGSADPYHQKLGDALMELRRTIADAGGRVHPDAAKAFKAADTAYANLVRVEGASKAAANNQGVFTPAQLQSAVRQADQSVRDRATARGSALMQDLSGAGSAVLGNKVPNSGTVDRALLLGTGAAGAASPWATGALLLGGAAAYTPALQNALRAAATARPQAAQAVSQSLLQATPRLVPGATQVGIGLLD